MEESDHRETSLLKRIVLHAARLPFIYLFIGIILIALSYLDDFFGITSWKNLLDITDKIGNIFIILSIVTYIYNIFVFLCLRYEQILTKNHKIASLIICNVRKSSRIIFILIAINFMITIISPRESYLMMANNVVNTILIMAIAWIAIQILYTIEAVLYQYMDEIRDKEHLRLKALYTKMRIIRNIATVVIITITIAAILMSFSSVRNIGISLLASAGFLTAIIGLSAQKTLFSLFSGIQIALSQPIKMGDIVVIENESGVV